jgi:hypothetical protein
MSFAQMPARRYGYAYVETAQLPSIRGLGYLSVAMQLQHGLVTAETLNHKYGMQHSAACKNYPDCPEQLVHYLDWRHEPTLDGSKAIYYMFAPIPMTKEILRGMKETRGDFLDGKTLLRLELPDDRSEYLIGDNDDKTPHYYRGLDSARWEEIWKAALQSDGGRPALWLQGIPHAMTVPLSGLIPPQNIVEVPIR